MADKSVNIESKGFVIEMRSKGEAYLSGGNLNYIQIFILHVKIKFLRTYCEK